MRKLKFTLILLSLLLGSVTLMAQVTTSSMSGKVTDNNGEPLEGATILATHVPSGTRYGAMANNQGSYSIQGMRPGGPYSVNVSFIGYKTESYTEITLALGENTTINSTLTSTAMEMATVTVVGYATSKFNTTRTGAVTNITNAQIDNLPTVNRSITDVTRLSPYGGNGMTFVGSDG
ncbi:MAG TPA: carboxypeptidase-like regulatory domain-containing protein, partial [Bacteroidales bacterium]|nr:carboxypeptidase-like regulatory domain-containing protein [Bacteroidales bacterium]